jgi:hypothetical protein
MSALQNLHGTFSLLFTLGTIWSRPHLGQVRLRPRIIAATLENITLISSSFTGFDNTRSKNALPFMMLQEYVGDPLPYLSPGLCKKVF